MPSLQLTTNVKVDDVKSFVLEFSKFSAQVLGKPESFISVSYTHNDSLTFGGSFDPAIILSVISLYNINPEENAKYSKEFFDFFEKKLGVKSHRGYIAFNDPGDQNLGYNGTTFELFRK